MKEYDVPFVRPETVQEVELVEQVKDSGEEVTVKEVIGEPFDVGADQEIRAALALGDADGAAGAAGGAKGVTGADRSEATDVPTPFVAVTENE